jgi:hypothetical protein
MTLTSWTTTARRARVTPLAPQSKPFAIWAGCRPKRLTAQSGTLSGHEQAQEWPPGPNAELGAAGRGKGEGVSEELTFTIKEWDVSFCVHLSDFIGELQALLASIPEEHRDNASIDFDCTGSDWDCSRGELSIQYSRPKTEDELRKEREDADREKLRRKAAEAAQERREYARLKAKFEGPSG